MKYFIYISADDRGDLQEKKLKANDLNQAKLYLKRQGIQYISVSEDIKKKRFWDIVIIPKKVGSIDIIGFSQLFASILEAGFTVKDALSLLTKQIEHPTLLDRLNQIYLSVQSGTSLSASFSKHTDIFPKFYPVILKTGEASGELAKVLNYITLYLEKIHNLKKELKSMLAYPITVSIISFLLLSVIIIFVAPTFKSFFGMGTFVLPLPTQVLFFISDFVVEYKYFLFFFFFSFISLFYFLFQNLGVRKRFDYLILKLPLIGGIFKQIHIFQFLKTFDILVNNNVPILQSLKLVEMSSTNLYFKSIFKEMREDAVRGLPISGALLHHQNVISTIVSYAVSMGEKSGTLSRTLPKMAQFVDQNLEFLIKSFSAKINPILTLCLGGVVIFVALAIYLPIFVMMGSLI